MPLMFRTVSGISAAGLFFLLLLQAIPAFGVFLMILGGPFWAGLLVHVVLIALVVESLARRIPRAFIAIPIVAYGSYYGLYAYQTIDIARISSDLRRSNSGKVLDFDTEKYSLVSPAAREFVTGHKIAVAYESNRNFEPEQHLSFRLIPRDQCKMATDTQHRIQTSGVGTGGAVPNGVCMLQFPETPRHPIVSVARIGDEEIWKRKFAITEQTSELSLDGKVVGTFKTASVWRLPLVPLVFVGCGLNSGSGAWRCGADVNRSIAALDTVPDGVDRERFDGPESVMLGIPKYSGAERADFRSFAETERALVWLADEPARVEDRMFALMRELAEGGYPKVPMGIGYSVSKNPMRLAPLGEAMANRFVELSNIRPSKADGQDYDFRYEGLAKALAALPDDAFAKAAVPLCAYYIDAMSSHFNNQFPALSIRSRCAFVSLTPDFYEADFMATQGYRQLFPTLAICRIGSASPAVITEMRARILRGSADAAFPADTKTALIVALLKLGQEAFIREYKSFFAANGPANLESWIDAVLSGKGATAVGPNNCMTMDWNGRRATKPSLAWANGVWFVKLD
jgi:hypothetical protein